MRVGIEESRINEMKEKKERKSRIRIGMIKIVRVGGNEVIERILNREGICKMINEEILKEIIRIEKIIKEDIEKIIWDIKGNSKLIDEIDDGEKMGGDNRRLIDIIERIVKREKKIVDEKVWGRIEVEKIGKRIIIIGYGIISKKDRGVIKGNEKSLEKEMIFKIRKLRKFGRKRIKEGMIELKRKKVRIGEIKIVMRILIGENGKGLEFKRIEKESLMINKEEILKNGNMEERLILDGMEEKEDRVEVIDIEKSEELEEWKEKRKIEVRKNGKLINIEVEGEKIEENSEKIGEVRERLIRREKIRIG